MKLQKVQKLDRRSFHTDTYLHHILLFNLGMVAVNVQINDRELSETRDAVA